MDAPSHRQTVFELFYVLKWAFAALLIPFLVTVAIVQAITLTTVIVAASIAAVALALILWRWPPIAVFEVTPTEIRVRCHGIRHEFPLDVIRLVRLARSHDADNPRGAGNHFAALPWCTLGPQIVFRSDLPRRTRRKVYSFGYVWFGFPRPEGFVEAAQQAVERARPATSP